MGLIKNQRKTKTVITFGLLITISIIIGTFDLIYGNGILGLLLYGVALVSLSGFSYGLNIFTGLGLVSRHKRESFSQSKGKPPFTLTINGDTKKTMHAKEKRYNETRVKRN